MPSSGKELVRIQRTSGNNLTVKSSLMKLCSLNQTNCKITNLWQNVVDLTNGSQDMDLLQTANTSQNYLKCSLTSFKSVENQY